MDHSLGTIVPSKVAFIPHETVRAFVAAHPRIGDMFWRDTLIDAAIFREWMVNIGRREAYGRIAHLLCELFVRLRAVGLDERRQLSRCRSRRRSSAMRPACRRST